MNDLEWASGLKRLGQPADALQNATRGVLRRGKDFEDLNLALLEDDAVRECPASVNTDAHKKSHFTGFRIQESGVRRQETGVRRQKHA
jgi:hypothetical protein